MQSSKRAQTSIPCANLNSVRHLSPIAAATRTNRTGVSADSPTTGPVFKPPPAPAARYPEGVEDHLPGGRRVAHRRSTLAFIHSALRRIAESVYNARLMHPLGKDPSWRRHLHLRLRRPFPRLFDRSHMAGRLFDRCPPPTLRFLSSSSTTASGGIPRA